VREDNDGSHDRTARHPLAEQREASRQLDLSSQLLETRAPRVLAALEVSRVGSVVVVRHADQRAPAVTPIETNVVAGAIIDFMPRLDVRILEREHGSRLQLRQRCKGQRVGQAALSIMERPAFPGQ
jgi:hypothetical protein